MTIVKLHHQLKRGIIVFLIIISSGVSCFSQDTDVKLLNDAVRNITNVILHDAFTPPVASRIYAYSTIAAYEILQQSTDSFPSLYGRLNKMPFLQESNGQVNYTLAAVLSLYYTAQTFLFSYKMLNPAIDSVMNYYRGFLSEKEIIDAQLWGSMMSMKMMSWAGKDHFKEIHQLPRYELIEAPYAWQPTPPDYADAVEPYWGKMRPFILDSANQFTPSNHLTFDRDSSSAFYREAFDVYITGKNLTEEQKEIANFWDDNPFTINYIGHLQFASKKISPVGHWMDITRIAIEQSRCDIVKAAYAYAEVSIAVADGFISCWNEKYSSNLIRPETYINQYIDEGWRPFLQTPPFPEFPSGHSVVSAASATILTDLFGSDFHFTDRIETEFDLPARSFTSFRQAADEASLSRFYGGIHYRSSVEAGAVMGDQVGKLVIEKLEAR